MGGFGPSAMFGVNDSERQRLDLEREGSILRDSMGMPTDTEVPSPPVPGTEQQAGWAPYHQNRALTLGNLLSTYRDWIMNRRSGGPESGLAPVTAPNALLLGKDWLTSRMLRRFYGG